MQRRAAPARKPTQQIPRSGGSTGVPLAATVVRRQCGTSPFDKHWLNVDCCGLFCAGFTYWLHLYGCYAVCFVLLPPWMSYEEDGEEGVRRLTYWGMFHSITFCGVAFLAVFSHFKAMTTDPGAVPPDAEPIGSNLDDPEQNVLDINGNGSGDGDMNIKEPLVRKPILRKKPKRLCRRCNAYKPERAHHCSVCKRCIIKMDHHCPWVNNCVGIGNHKYFLLFVFYTFVSCTYSMTLVIARFVNCIGHMNNHEPCLDKPTHLLSLIGLVVESMLFGMFTCCMMVDQWDVVLTKVTHIDRLKGEVSTEDDGTGGMNEVFGVGLGKGKKGSNFRPDWLSPMTDVCFPESMRDEIMGFCRPCGFMGCKVKEEDYEPTGASGRRVVNNVAEIV